MPAPPELAAIQGFLGPLFRREEAIEGDPRLEEACASHVAAGRRLSPAQQVDLYRRQFWLRHLGSLREDYPGLERLLGEAAFEAFARAYLAAHPPRTPSLRDLGADLVPFAERYESFDPALREAALEMARYEHAFVDLFDGPEAPTLDPQKLASVPDDGWDRARIVIDPRIVRLRLRFPVHRLRLAARSGETFERPPAPSPVDVVLFRDDEGTIHFDELAPAAFALLDALAGGEALVPACERLAAGLDDAEAAALQAQVGAWFQRWTARRWIIDVVP
jgi:hypothetical protein